MCQRVHVPESQHMYVTDPTTSKHFGSMLQFIQDTVKVRMAALLLAGAAHRLR